MGVTKFKHDVALVAQRAQAGTIPSITSITPGPRLGQVVITVSHEYLSSDLQIHATCEDPDQYPGDTTFALSVGKQAPNFAVDAVNSFKDFVFGMSLYEVALAISNSFKDAHPQVEDPDEAVQDEEDESAEEFSGADYNESEDDGLGTGTLQPRTHQADLHRRMKRDLREARKAGYRVGFLDPAAKNAHGGTVSLSIRINKLGLSKELMEAWDVEPTDYFVLLIKLGSPYPTMDVILDRPAELSDVVFRVGQCSSYKPSPEQAALAFLRDCDRPSATGADEPGNRPDSFRKLFISNSLDQYMNQNLISHIRIRNRDGCTWDAATETYRQEQTNRRSESLAALTPSAPPSTRDLPSPDHWAAARRQGSFPLVAMQFAMRNFMKCNSFCLVCHRPVLDDGIEALRPYVCSEPLCLFQYLSMGFGPSIEHEILTQPLVVDLLVSLCYKALNGGHVKGPPKIRDLPVGLQLHVPAISESWGNALQGEMYFESIFHSAPSRDLQIRRRGTLVVPRDSLPVGTKLSGGQWIAFRAGSTFNVHHAQITDVVGDTVEVEEVAFVSGAGRPSVYNQEIGPNTVAIVLYDTDFDTLAGIPLKLEAMRHILDSLPSVRHMAAYLRSHPGCALRSMPRITPTAVSLLAWVISSNRSCVYQIDQSLPEIVDGPSEARGTAPTSGPSQQTAHLGQLYQRALPGTHSQRQATPMETSPDADMTCGRNREQERIWGMDGWVQFRFAQGSPDKELRFKQALQTAHGSDVTKFPTVLAWHGSSVTNWHNILRTGLNYEAVVNGRAYGDGVYFSRLYDTSSLYSSTHSGPGWANSEIKVKSCVSLNEIINVRSQWRSQAPHYVIAQPDWHQCRYLFVERVGSSPGAAPRKGESIPAGSKPSDLFPQEPGWEILGPRRQTLQVPRSAIPFRGASSEKGKGTGKGKPISPKRKRAQSPESEVEDEDDRAFLFSDDEDSKTGRTLPAHKKQNHSPESDWTVLAGGAGPAKRETRPMTDFVPGSLNLSTLPRLGEPSFSNNMALRALGRELKKLQAVQAKTPLHELGWYIHAEAITNLFQWIVELHSFDASLPLAADMKQLGITSIVLEIRFPADFPMSPPFVRVVRPRFLPFTMGGGGHVTGGGAMCMELLTSSGWSPANSMESVLLQVRLAMTNLEPRPGRIWSAVQGHRKGQYYQDYGVDEAIEGYMRAVGTHGWKVPAGLRATARGV